MNRGARRASIFGEPAAAALFQEVLAELPSRFGVRVLAFAIMPNHFHLLLECPDGNLSRAMQYLGAEFTQRTNRQLQWDGPMFRGRFKSRLVEDPAYLAYLFAYVHMNPVKAGLARHPDSARWTSHRALVGLERAPSWLDRDGLTRAFGSREAYRAYLEDYIAGRLELPPEWDAKSLWKPSKPGLKPTSRTDTDVAGLLAEVAIATGTSPAELVRPRRGRTGNQARAVAAWWLSTHGRMQNVAIAKALNCSPGRVSQMRSAVENGREFAPWKGILQAPATPLVLAEGSGRSYLAFPVNVAFARFFSLEGADLLIRSA